MPVLAGRALAGVLDRERPADDDRQQGDGEDDRVRQVAGVELEPLPGGVGGDDADHDEHVEEGDPGDVEDLRGHVHGQAEPERQQREPEGDRGGKHQAVGPREHGHRDPGREAREGIREQLAQAVGVHRSDPVHRGW